jgi:hypothetical protein
MLLDSGRELMWDRLCGIAMEKQGHQKPVHATQHIRDLAHVEGLYWGGLVIILNILTFHTYRTGQVQMFKGLWCCRIQ